MRLEFAYDGGGLGKGGTATVYIDGEAAGEGRIEQTEAFLFSTRPSTSATSTAPR